MQLEDGNCESAEGGVEAVQTRQLSSIAPQLGGGFLKLIGYLALELNRRLSQLTPENQYISFNYQLEVLLSNLRTVVKQNDVMDIRDLMIRIQML